MAESIRIFVSSPGDALDERRRLDRVVERLNGELAGIAHLETVRWERQYYTAHASFQEQIPEAAACDIVVAILRHRLGTELPDDFARMPDGKPYPSGTAYEILTAMEAGRTKGLPDLYVFRFPEPPVIRLDDTATNAIVTEQWERLKVFFSTWFQTPEGQFKAAFQEFRSTDDFETQIEALLRNWLEEKILKGRSVVWPVETKGSPFRGLAAFGARHAPVFFGRARTTQRAVDSFKDAAARGMPFLLVVGPSGSGKSSLVRAGLVPRLTASGVVPAVDLWRVAEMRPGEAQAGPTASLASRLLQGADDLDEEETGRPFALPELRDGDYKDAGQLAGLLRHADDSATKPILAALEKIGEAERLSGGHDRPMRADLLIVIDQLDELFGADVGAEERARFARLLSVLLASGRVWVVATLRADLYEQFLREPILLELKTRGGAFDLAPPGPADMAEIVRGPAAAADLEFDTDPKTGERLDDRLLADADRPDMLPLLQFALEKLFEQRATGDGRAKLTFAAYREFGGIDGAINQAGELVIGSVGKDQAASLPKLLRLLARQTPNSDNIAGSGSLTLRSVSMREIEKDAPMAALAKALVAGRLLVMGSDAGGASIALAHQRILDSWVRARQAVGESVNFYRILSDVRDQMRRWVASACHPANLLPGGPALRDARAIVKKYDSELDTGVRNFVKASFWRQQFRTLYVKIALIMFSLIIMLIVSVLSKIFKEEPITVGNFFLSGVFAWFIGAIFLLSAYRYRVGLTIGQIFAKEISSSSWLPAIIRKRFRLTTTNIAFMSLYVLGQAINISLDQDTAIAQGVLMNVPILIVWGITAEMMSYRIRRAIRSGEASQEPAMQAGPKPGPAPP